MPLRDASYYREHADHCRNLAAMIYIPDLRLTLLNVATQFDALAREADRRSNRSLIGEMNSEPPVFDSNLREATDGSDA